MTPMTSTQRSDDDVYETKITSTTMKRRRCRDNDAEDDATPLRRCVDVDVVVAR